MKKRSVAIFAAKTMFSWLWLVSSGLILAGWWLPTFGEPLGTGDVDTTRRVGGILMGIWLIANGNGMPKAMLLPPSHANAAVLQRFLRFFGWAGVLTGAVLVVCWLALPVERAYDASAFFGGLGYFGAMFLVWRRVHHVTGEPRGI